MQLYISIILMFFILSACSNRKSEDQLLNEMCEKKKISLIDYKKRIKSDSFSLFEPDSNNIYGLKINIQNANCNIKKEFLKTQFFNGVRDLNNSIAFKDHRNDTCDLNGYLTNLVKENQLEWSAQTGVVPLHRSKSRD